MKKSIAFARIFFTLLSFLLMTAVAISSIGAYSIDVILLGAVLGATAAAFLFTVERLLSRYPLKAFTTLLLGLFFGYLMGQALVWIFGTALTLSGVTLPIIAQQGIGIGIFLLGLYLGTVITIRSAEEFAISLPFIRFTDSHTRQRDIFLEASVLTDPRFIDFIRQGILDGRVVIPKFVLKELHVLSDHEDESTRSQAKKALDAVKKLESMSSLALRIDDIDYPEIKDPVLKLVQLAKDRQASVFSADVNRLELCSNGDVQIINLGALSNALKPIMQSGEHLRIKVQRYGKETKQGVGYLEDGTMVVVNGGGDFIGETVKARVLSVKHTSAGRMIFCNITDEQDPSEAYLSTVKSSSSRDAFAQV